MILLGLIGSIVLGIALGYYAGAKRALSNESKAESSQSAANDSLNKQYNEMISEVSVLIRESIEKANLDREIELASSVQNTVLPPSESQYDSILVTGRCYMAGSCGGDWWYHTRQGNSVVVWVGDVTGHGIASALVASACRAVASALVFKGPEQSVKKWMALMNDVVFDMTEGRVCVTVLCLKIDLRTGDFEVCNASHPTIFHLHSDKSPTIIETPMNLPVGKQKSVEYETKTEHLRAGDGLFLMTDGLMELKPHQDEKRIRWNFRGLLKYLSSPEFQNTTATRMVETVDTLFHSDKSRQLDDVTFVAITRSGTSEMSH